MTEVVRSCSGKARCTPRLACLLVRGATHLLSSLCRSGLQANPTPEIDRKSVDLKLGY